MSAWGWLAWAIVATATGQLLFKHASVARSRMRTGIAVGIFCLAPPAAFMALRELSLATVYISTVLAQLLVVLASLIWFRERYAARQWIGLGLIVTGVVVFNLPET